MKVTLDQIFLLNNRIGDTVYSINDLGLLDAASLPKRYIREHMLEDMIDSQGNLTARSIQFAREILGINQ